VNFENNLDFKVSPIALDVQTDKTLFIIGNVLVVKEIIRSMSEAVS